MPKEPQTILLSVAVISTLGIRSCRFRENFVKVLTPEDVLNKVPAIFPLAKGDYLLI